jgi:hypothetical protein
MGQQQGLSSGCWCLVMRYKKNDGSALSPTPFENSLRNKCGEGDLGGWECIEAREVPWEASNIPSKLPTDSRASKFAPNTPSLHPSDYPSATFTPSREPSIQPSNRPNWKLSIQPLSVPSYDPYYYSMMDCYKIP